MQTNYNRGTKFEHYLKRRYASKGYSVHRMAGSHSPIDLIAINATEVILIQCKSSSIEELPNVNQLLKPTSMEDVRSKINGVWVKVPTEVKSNIKLLEELEVPECTYKLIIWKGKGINNYFTFEWLITMTNEKDGIFEKKLRMKWIGKAGLPI